MLGFDAFGLVCLYLAVGLTWGAIVLMTNVLWRYHLWSAYVKFAKDSGEIPERRMPVFEWTLWMTVVVVWPIDLYEQFVQTVVVGYRLHPARLPGELSDEMPPWYQESPRYMPKVNND